MQINSALISDIYGKISNIYHISNLEKNKTCPFLCNILQIHLLVRTHISKYTDIDKHYIKYSKADTHCIISGDKRQECSPGLSGIGRQPLALRGRGGPHWATPLMSARNSEALMHISINMATEALLPLFGISFAPCGSFLILILWGGGIWDVQTYKRAVYNCVHHFYLSFRRLSHT